MGFYRGIHGLQREKAMRNAMTVTVTVRFADAIP
jgi:hypothetical protein